MKVKTRLSLFCSLIFGIVFAILSLTIYTLYYRNTQRAIYSHLEKVAFIAAWFYLEEDELSAKEFEKIRLQFEETAANACYQVYNENNDIDYGVSSGLIPTELLNRVRRLEHVTFVYDNQLCYGLFYEDNQGDFVVIAKEQKALLDAQTHLLLWIILIAFVIGLTAIIFLSRWVASIAYRPFTHVIEQVKNISTKNLDVKIDTTDAKDELNDLIETFNELLEKIAGTVVIQRNFVKYVSHEFKTPLAALLGNLDLLAMKGKDNREIQQVTSSLISQVIQLKEILETLLVISDLKPDQSESASVRIDELLWEIIKRIKTVDAGAKIRFDIQIQPEELDLLTVPCEATQLLIALYNLIGNGVKYSEHKDVRVMLFRKENQLALSIEDQGIGIPKEQLELINKPFFRADNTSHVEGSGIGLSLTMRILDKLHIRYTIHSELNRGTRILLQFDQPQPF